MCHLPILTSKISILLVTSIQTWEAVTQRCLRKHLLKRVSSRRSQTTSPIKRKVRVLRVWLSSRSTSKTGAWKRWTTSSWATIQRHLIILTKKSRRRGESPYASWRSFFIHPVLPWASQLLKTGTSYWSYSKSYTIFNCSHLIYTNYTMKKYMLFGNLNCMNNDQKVS